MTTTQILTYLSSTNAYMYMIYRSLEINSLTNAIFNFKSQFGTISELKVQM